MSESKSSRPVFEVPDAITALGPAAVDTINALVREAERTQGRELRDATNRTLKIVPWPLRGVVKRIVGA